MARDLQPPAILFRSSLPDGIAVPTCATCRERSQAVEQALSLLVETGERKDCTFQAWQARIDFVRDRFPELVPAQGPSIRESRTMLRESGICLPEGLSYRDVRTVSLDPSDWGGVFDLAARALVLAQHYRFLRRPLSKEGRLHARLVPQAEVGQWLDELVGELPQLGAGRRGDEDLGDRIRLHFYIGSDDRVGVFVTHVREMFVVVGMTGEGPRWSEIVDLRGSSGPFD